MNLREIKFQSIHKDLKSGKISFTEWGTIPGGFKSPGSHSNSVLIGHREYTGLKDKNGKEIYEGDILQDSEAIAKVVFENGQFVAQYETFSAGWKSYAALWEYLKDWVDVEIIGNIYENPELLTPTPAAP